MRSLSAPAVHNSPASSGTDGEGKMLDTHLTQLAGLWKYRKTMGSQSEATLGLKNQLEKMYKKTVRSQSQIKASET